MSENRSIDSALCDRFMTALTSCFSDETGKFKEDAAAAKLPALDRGDLPAIRRHERQPSELVVDEMTRACDAFDTGWLRTGMIDENVCDRLFIAMDHHRIDPVDAAKVLFVTKEFFSLVKDHRIMPSRIFINRLCETYDIPLEDVFG
ncbi:MAG: hypothetical protein ACLFVQ_07680 [Chitinispirillaceae bacterium]